MELAAEANTPLMVGGTALVALYLACHALLTFPLRVRDPLPGLFSSMAGLVLVLASTWASLGIAGLLCSVGFRFEPQATQVGRCRE